jgi:hypothetical protein
MKYKTILASLCVMVLSMGLALFATAGSVDDTDGDLIPDVFDNCSLEDNGPGEVCNQTDTDGDGFGNNCDGDFDGDNTVLGTDFTAFLGFFGGVGNAGDLDCDGTTLGTDFTKFLGLFGGNPGPGSTAL